MLNLCEMRYRFQTIAGWVRTYHNVTADYITRCSQQQFEDLSAEKGWEVVQLGPAIQQSVIDSKQFGTCFLSWGEDEDRNQNDEVEGTQDQANSS